MPFRNKDGTFNWGQLANVCIVLPIAWVMIVKGVTIYQLPDEFKEFKINQIHHNKTIESELGLLLYKENILTTNQFTHYVQGGTDGEN